MSEKFKMPQTIEEARERQAILLEQLNKYNEEYFEGTPSLSEEEITIIQEEYQFLEDMIGIEPEVVIEEPTEKGFFDKVSIFVWIYAVFAFFSSLYILQCEIGFSIMELILTINSGEWVFGMNHFLLMVIVLGVFLVYPLLLVGLGSVLKTTVFSKLPENKKAMKYVLLSQIGLLALNFIFTYFIVIEEVYLQLSVL